MIEDVVQQHFYALVIFGIAAFMLGVVARAVADHLLGRKRDRERALRDMLWREVELSIELDRLREQIRTAPPDVRAGALALMFEQIKHWSTRMRALAAGYGHRRPPPDDPRERSFHPDLYEVGSASLVEPKDRLRSLEITSAWNAPVDGD